MNRRIALALFAAASTAIAVLAVRSVQPAPPPPVARSRGGALGDAAAAAPIKRTAVPAAAAAADAGTLWTYEFTASSALQLGAQASVTRLVGTMTVRVLDTRHGERLAEVAFPGVEVAMSPDGAANRELCARLEAGLRRGARVRRSARGEVLAYGFAADADGDLRNQVRTLVAALNVVVEDDRERWSALEADSLGAVQRDYERLGAGASGGDLVRLRRTRRCYPELDRARPSGCAIATLGAGWPWPATIEVDEALSLALPEVSACAEGQLRARFTLCNIDVVAVDAADWTGPWAPADGAGERSEHAAAAARRAWQQRLAGVTLDQLLGELVAATGAQAAAAERMAAIEALARLIALRPEELAALASRLRDPQQDPGLVAALLRAVARAGTEPAQALLAALAGDAALPTALRRDALEVLFAVHRPAPAIVARVERLVAAGAGGPLTAVDTAALLLLGAMTSRGVASPDVLQAAEVRAQREQQLPAWLEAVGNAGGELALQAARRYADDGDEHVRAAAMTALRKVGAAAAVSLLAERAVSDTAAAVRRCAVEALAESPAAVPATLLATVAVDDPDESVRAAALRGLYHRAPQAQQTRSLLEQRADLDPSATVRALARGLLGR